jgi:hypothetical protein
MIRRLIAGLVVVGLAIGVWALWPREEPDPSPTTTVNGVDSTTTISASDPVTSTTLESHVVTTVEEAEVILRELWFGWFEGIYNQDEDRIREVVGSQVLLDSAVRAFPTAQFLNAPTEGGVRLDNSELLFADEQCLVVWATLDVSSFSGTGAVETSVHVLRWVDDSWHLTTLWVNRDDLWEADCDSQLEPLV